MKTKALDIITNGTPWLIQPKMLETIIEIARRDTDIKAVKAQLDTRLENTQVAEVRDGVAIIPVTGPIFPKANLFTEMSGATSVEMLALDFNTALDDRQVHSIVLDFHSPGGQTTGIHEFAQMVADAAKPVTAYVGGLAASAAFWIAAAANDVVADATAMLGSIGVVAAVYRDNDPDVVEFVSSNAEDKRPNIDTDQGRAVIQAEVNALEAVFIESISQFRGLETGAIKSGRGRVFVGASAIEVGFADRLGSLESVIAGLSGNQRRGVFMPAAKKTPGSDNQPVTLTAAIVKADYPDVYDAIYNQASDDVGSELDAEHKENLVVAAATERERIQAVQTQLLPGHEALIESLKFDGKTTGAEAAVAVLQAEKGLRKDNLEAIHKDRPDPVPASSESDAPTSKFSAAEIAALARERVKQAEAKGQTLSIAQAVTQIKTEAKTP